MGSYATVLLYAIPAFLILVLLELAYGYLKKDVTQTLFDTISSLSSGITNAVKDSLGIVVIVISYPFLFHQFSLFHLESSWIIFTMAFIAIDFSEYWIHRISHKVNFFWNKHLIHHSSEEFNLPCALRQPISNLFGIFAIFLLPAAILGIPVEVISLIAPIHLFLQFWYHTKYIGNLGWLEYIIVTPSQHRVHHAINPIYIDKNLSAVFCIWDRLFGTFQEELKSDSPVFGTIKPAQTWNPFKINFIHLSQLMNDAYHTSSLLDKVTLWIKPTGWRPDDVIHSRPIKINDKVHDQIKYDTKPSKKLKRWVLYRFVTTFILFLYMLSQFDNYSIQYIFCYGLIIALSIYGYSALMDRERWAFLYEWIFAIAGLTLFFVGSEWFGVHKLMTFGNLLIIGYFVTAGLGSSIFADEPIIKNK